MCKLVSVIVPSYKRHTNLVERAILSLLNQTYQNIEIILVDDNAKECLIEYRLELEKLVNRLSDNRIVYIQNHDNLGGAGSRNEGIKKANGEYITFLDDDDEYLPKKVEIQLKFMVQYNLDCSFTKLCIYNEHDKLIDVREHDIKSYDQKYLKTYHLTKQITGTPTFMIKKNVLDNIGGFDIVSMGQEYYLMKKIIWANYKIGYLPECYVKAYRTKDEAISTGKNKINGEKQIYKFKKSFFNQLNGRSKRYIRCRHYAVLAVAYKRNKKIIRSVIMLIISFLSAPILAIKEAKDLFKRKKEVLQ